MGILRYLHLSGSTMVAQTTSGSNSDQLVRLCTHDLLLECAFVPSTCRTN